MVKKILLVITVIICIFLVLFPLYIMFRMSVSVPADVFKERPAYFIENFTWEHFGDVFRSGSMFLNPLKKSFIVALLTSVFSLLIAVPAAYAISKFDYRLRYALVLTIFITRMIPEVSIALSISITFIKMGLFDNIFGLTLAHLIRILPVSCFILVGVFSSFPAEIEKQAQIDGCSRLRALLKVVFPLSLGGISVAGIFSFLLSWDEFIYASYLSLANPTMPLKMYYYVSRGNLFYSATYAIIITIPVLLITLILQKYLRPGYLAGGIKG